MFVEQALKQALDTKNTKRVMPSAGLSYMRNIIHEVLSGATSASLVAMASGYYKPERKKWMQHHLGSPAHYCPAVAAHVSDWQQAWWDLDELLAAEDWESINWTPS